MPEGMPGNKAIHVAPDEVEAMGKLIAKEIKKTGKKITEYSIMKAALRAHLKLDK